MRRFQDTEWALILGGSSGFGLATATKLAEEGMSVLVVHRDRRGGMERVEAAFSAIRAQGHGFASLNVDALGAEGMTAVVSCLREKMGPEGRVRALLHSIAYGNLRPLVSSRERGALEAEDFARTVHAMGTSLVDWVQRLHAEGLFAPDARVFGLTSEGNTVAWEGYAAVGAAKAALESVARAIAVEFAPHGIRANVIQAGVTDTPALRLIPGAERLMEVSRRRNPFGRLTRPEDVAGVVSLLCRDEAAWMNGALIRVDGGEHVSAPF